MSADDVIPMPIAAAIAYGRLVEQEKAPSLRELNERLQLLANVLTVAIPSSQRVDGGVSATALFDAIERLRREAAVQSSEIIPR